LKTPRSVLAVPGANLEVAGKALASDADAVFLDLEDAVAPGEKAGARKSIIRALRELDWRDRSTLYRANALDTPYFYRDLVEIVEEAADKLDAIMIPKVQLQRNLHVADTLLSQLEAAVGLDSGKIKIEGQIESAEGLLNVDDIALATERLAALHFGPGDFAASVRMPQINIGTMDEWDETYPGHRFHYAMQRIVAAARSAGLRAVDGPVADYRDEEGLRQSCLIARSLGFDGKWCIHPAQIEVVNEVFSPTEREIEWAKKVVEAYEEANAAGTGAISIDGQMIDAASIKMAQNTLDLARGVGMV
jgi:citrate lyase beta subunit